MIFTKLVLSLLFILITSFSAIATELPLPPSGYSWVAFDEVKGAFLKPRNWNFKITKIEDTIGYFITKENIDSAGEFFTGLSVNVIPNIPQKTKMTPSRYAAAFIGELVNDGEVFKQPWSTTTGVFEGHGVVIQHNDGKTGPFITHNLAIANDETGTVYILIFESPSDTWEESWKIGKPILQRFLIDDTI